MSQAEFLTPAELSQRWRGTIKVGTLANWRSAKTGPAYTKARGKVLYPMDKIIAWEAANTANDNEPQK